MAEVFGPERRAAVCRELTKTYEEVKRGGAGRPGRRGPRRGCAGEITVVVEGAPEKGAEEIDAAELVRRVRVREEAGERRKEAIAAVAVEAGVPKRVVFDAVVAAKNTAPDAPGELGHTPSEQGAHRLSVRPMRAKGCLGMQSPHGVAGRFGKERPNRLQHSTGLSRIGAGGGVHWSEGRTRPPLQRTHRSWHE